MMGFGMVLALFFWILSAMLHNESPSHTALLYGYVTTDLRRYMSSVAR